MYVRVQCAYVDGNVCCVSTFGTVLVKQVGQLVFERIPQEHEAEGRVRPLDDQATVRHLVVLEHVRVHVWTTHHTGHASSERTHHQGTALVLSW